jgi:hypothetical protein
MVSSRPSGRAVDQTILKRILIRGGWIAGLVALLWWGIFYAEVADRTGDRIATVYREAFPCLIYTTGPCAIVAAIAEFGGYPAYRPFLMWIAVGLFVGGAVVPAARAKRD